MFAAVSGFCAVEIDDLGDIRTLDEIQIILCFPCLESVDESMRRPLLQGAFNCSITRFCVQRKVDDLKNLLGCSDTPLLVKIFKSSHSDATCAVRVRPSVSNGFEAITMI